MIRVIFAVLSLTGSLAFADALIKPDPEMTSGDFCEETDADFKEYRYGGTVAICERNVDRFVKDQIYREYKIPRRCRIHFTVDHYIPLSMGGSNQKINLWPEHKDVKATRKNLEQEIYRALVEGAISQDDAVKVIMDAKMNPPPVDLTECE